MPAASTSTAAATPAAARPPRVPRRPACSWACGPRPRGPAGPRPPSARRADCTSPRPGVPERVPERQPFHLLLLRHGQTDANATGVLQGHQPNALNELGRQQAQRLAARVARHHPRITALISSDLRRAAHGDMAPPGAESVPEFRARVLGAMDSVARKYAREPAVA